MTTVGFRRAAATSPGKHGPLDWRVTLSGLAPEHSEVVFVVGMLLLAEDRYHGRGHLGRHLLWYYLDRLLMAKTPEAVVAVAQDCQDSLTDPPRPLKVRASA